MLGIIVLGIMQGISSLRDLERFSRRDLGCLWVSGGLYPDHSVLGRFIQRHEGLLTADFFEQLTRQVLKVTGSGTAMVAGDGTVIEAAASRFKLMRQEALTRAIETTRAERDAADSEEEQEKAGARVAQLEQAQQQLKERQAVQRAKGKHAQAERMQIPVQEPDAVVQPQKDKKRFLGSYKPSVLANEIRVILGIDVHPSSETAVVARLLAQAQAQGTVETALLDAGYFNEAIIRLTQQESIELLCPEGQSWGSDWNKQSQQQYLKSQLSYDPEQDQYHCPQGQILRQVGRYLGNDQNPGYVLYGTEACQHCAQQAQCTRSTKGRRIKRYDCDAQKDRLRAMMANPETQHRYLKRQGMVEPVFAYLRERQGLNRFRRRGLPGVRLEFALHALAYNLSRAVVYGRLIKSHISLFLTLPSPLSRFSVVWQKNQRRLSNTPDVVDNLCAL